MPQPTLIAGMHIKCFINGVLLGLITTAQWSIGTEFREAREIDSNVVKEQVPGAFSVRGAFGILRGRSSGGLEGAGLVASGQDMLLQKLMTIELHDRITEEVIFRATGCQVLNQTWGISPKQLVTGQFTWSGITFSNESST